MRGKLVCELCISAEARMHCESDQAILCWDCDAKVHSANFLVAKHTRTLLCHVCHSRTPWKAAGQSLGRTVSVCDVCVGKSNNAGRISGARADHQRTSDAMQVAESDGAVPLSDGCGVEELDEDEDYDGSCSDRESDGIDESSGSEYDYVEEDDDDIQVVPWTSTPSPPPASDSSSGEEESSFGGRGGAGSGSFKRMRGFNYLHDEDDDVDDGDVDEGAIVVNG